MVAFLVANWYAIIMTGLAVFLVIFLAVRGQTKSLEGILFALVTQAEKEFGGGTGELKLATVIKWAYEKMPTWARAFITVERLTNMINQAVETAKEKWDNNPAIKTWLNAGSKKK